MRKGRKSHIECHKSQIYEIRISYRRLARNWASSLLKIGRNGFADSG